MAAPPATSSRSIGSGSSWRAIVRGPADGTLRTGAPVAGRFGGAVGPPGGELGALAAGAVSVAAGAGSVAAGATSSSGGAALPRAGWAPAPRAPLPTRGGGPPPALLPRPPPPPA